MSKVLGNERGLAGIACMCCCMDRSEMCVCILLASSEKLYENMNDGCNALCLIPPLTHTGWSTRTGGTTQKTALDGRKMAILAPPTCSAWRSEFGCLFCFCLSVAFSCSYLLHWPPVHHVMPSIPFHTLKLMHTHTHLLAASPPTCPLLPSCVTERPSPKLD